MNKKNSNEQIKVELFYIFGYFFVFINSMFQKMTNCNFLPSPREILSTITIVLPNGIVHSTCCIL